MQFGFCSKMVGLTEGGLAADCQRADSHLRGEPGLTAAGFGMRGWIPETSVKPTIFEQKKSETIPVTASPTASNQFNFGKYGQSRKRCVLLIKPLNSDPAKIIKNPFLINSLICEGPFQAIKIKDIRTNERKSLIIIESQVEFSREPYCKS